MSKIYGDTVGGGGLNLKKVPQSDWNQTDETQCDYIKNKPELTNYQTKSDDALDTDDKTVVGAVNELSNKTVDKIACMEQSQSVESVSYSENDGIFWSVSGRMLDEDDSTISEYSCDQNAPIVAGDNISFTVDEDNNVVKINAAIGSYDDLTGTPTKLSDFDNDKGFATESYVDTKVADMVDSAPETLNTLNELAAALGDDPNFAATIATEIGKKVDKVSGKGLSTNDFTTEEKNKLNSVPTDIAKLNSTITELNYMSGVTSNVQDQLNAKSQVQIIIWEADD